MTTTPTREQAADGWVHLLGVGLGLPAAIAIVRGAGDARGYGIEQVAAVAALRRSGWWRCWVARPPIT